MTEASPAPIRRPTASVLMSTYAKEKAANLEASLASLRDQTVRPDQVVLVVDGPVGPDQEAVIERFSDPTVLGLTVVRQAENGGLANAMNAGIPACTGEYIMRFDSDDLCLPDRVEVQLDYAMAHPGTDMICSWSEDFFDDGEASQLKAAPVGHDAVVRALHWRNIIQHSSVCVKAEVLKAVGAYRSKYGLLEDYDLFVRIAQHGARIHIIPKVLVRIRSSLDQRQRRGGLGYCMKEIKFRVDMYRTGFLGLGEFLLVTSMYTVFRLVSGGMRKRLYVLART